MPHNNHAISRVQKSPTGPHHTRCSRTAYPHLYLTNSRFIPAQDAVKLQKTFTRIYPLDNTKEGLQSRHLAMTNPEAYVLKPQREGGGNNIYRDKIPGFLKSLPSEWHYNAYILMELIQPPPLTNSIIREGRVVTGGVVCELGVYGTILWDENGEILE